MISSRSVFHRTLDRTGVVTQVEVIHLLINDPLVISRNNIYFLSYL